MLEKKDDIRIVKRLQNSCNSEIRVLEKINNNNSFSKEINTIKKTYSNHILDGTTGEESKSKGSILQKKKGKKKIKKKSESLKNKKKDKEKISKLLKNERLKIPKGKRMSIANDTLKFNLNNIEKIIKSLPKTNSSFERRDSYGNIINKENKKHFHIRFQDNIPSNKLIEIIPIESFKQYNTVENMPDEEILSCFHKCCLVFW